MSCTQRVHKSIRLYLLHSSSRARSFKLKLIAKINQHSFQVWIARKVQYISSFSLSLNWLLCNASGHLWAATATTTCYFVGTKYNCQIDFLTCQHWSDPSRPKTTTTWAEMSWTNPSCLINGYLLRRCMPLKSFLALSFTRIVASWVKKRRAVNHRK